MGNNYLIDPYQYNTPNALTGSSVWTIVSFVLALVGCFVIYFLFVNKKEEIKDKKLAWVKSFLSFDKMLIETILKITYLFLALFITLASFSLIGENFVSFLIVLIGGNLLVRVIYEASLILIMIWKNTTDIKKKLK